MTPELFVGVMSGTSLDGIDVATVLLGGVAERPDPARLLGYSTERYESAFRDRLRDVAENRANTADVCRLNFELGERFAEAVAAALRALGLEPGEIRAIGSHGQTVWHAPPPAGGAAGVNGAAVARGEGDAGDEGGARGAGGVNGGAGDSIPSTLQIGEAAVLAERTGISVIADFRVRDVAAGGHGAPLTPYFDHLILSSADVGRVIQNLGGMANLTALPADPAYSPVAFDTGPGMALIDAAMELLTDGEARFDDEGRLARRGQVLEGPLAEWLADPFFAESPPRSTGRERFGTQRVREWLAAHAEHSAEDLVATLTELTVRSIADSYAALDFDVEEVYLSGGGARNRFLHSCLADRLHGKRIASLDELGWPADAREAAAFALLARQHVLGFPIDIGWATGGSGARILGKQTPA